MLIKKTDWPDGYTSFCQSVSWRAGFPHLDSMGWVCPLSVDWPSWVFETSSLRITPQMTEFMKVVITQIHTMVAVNIHGVLTVSNIIPRALYVFTLLILTNGVGVIIIILILWTRKQRNRKCKHLPYGRTASDLQSQESNITSCQGVVVTSRHPSCRDSNQYGWVPWYSHPTFLLGPSRGDEAVTYHFYIHS